MKRMITILLAAPMLVSAQAIPAQMVSAVPSVAVLSDGAVSDQPYLAFPALLDLGDDVLISYKRGKTHAADLGATLELLRINGQSGAIKTQKTIAAVENQIMQMGEWVRFANGEIVSYIDAQKKGQPSRIGLLAVRSQDGGQTFGPVERVGVIDGVEYGYAFEAITRGPTTWMLAMTFTNLTGGVYRKRLQRPVAGSVDVIRSDNNGGSWRFVRSITRELGDASINESSFAPCGEGFLLTARGYDNRQWLVRTDPEFQIIRKTDLTATREDIRSHIGRPRLFERDGAWYLLGRNSVDKGPMRLSLFRFDPQSLQIVKHVMLDNTAGEQVSDGYYAMPYWREHAGKTRLYVVTYKAEKGPPKIIRLDYDWEQVR